MKKAIYLITNNINQKKYVGQSICPKDRFKAHCRKCKEYTSLISKAINKYGKENFSFKIIGWFEDYNEKEQEYIAAYKTLAPNGYNIAIGGEDPPHPIGEAHPRALITQEQVSSIKKDLKNWDLRFYQIVKKYRITKDILRHINDGSSWNDKKEKYPIRPQEEELDNMRATIVKKLLMQTTLSQTDIGKLVGWNRSAVTMINIGANHFDEKMIYPLRGPVGLSKQQVLQIEKLLTTTDLNFKEISNIVGCDSRTVRKINKGEVKKWKKKRKRYPLRKNNNNN